MLKDLLSKNRSYRRFVESARIEQDVLVNLIDLARLAPSSVNMQPLRFALVNDSKINARVFETLGWAGLLKDWNGPEEGERPSAYIVILCDNTIAKNMKTDVGITAQTIMLGAVENGFGGCMLGSVDRSKLAEILNIDTQRYSIELVLALGKPAETVRIVDIPENGSTAYYRDEKGIHYVPKRSADELIINN